MIMKFVTTDNRVLMAILVIASIGGTLAAVQGFGLVNYHPQNQLPGEGAAMLTGNVKVFQYDKDGNIIAYRQSDNHIVKDGMEIIMAQVFRGINSSANYAAPALGLPHPVQYMQIGTGQETHRLLHNDTSIATAIPTCFTRASAAITNTTGSHGYHTTSGVCNDTNNMCWAQMNVTAQADFLGSAGCNVNSIDEAGIFDNSTGGNTGQYQTGVLTVPNGGGYMFARNTFGSVNLGNADTLRLQWEFTFTDS